MYFNPLQAEKLKIHYKQDVSHPYIAFLCKHCESINCRGARLSLCKCIYTEKVHIKMHMYLASACVVVCFIYQPFYSFARC